MEDERRQFKEYFDSVEMTEEFRQKLLSLPHKETASPKAVPAKRRWKPAVIAAALCILCLAALPLLRQPARRSPKKPAAARVDDATQADPTPVSAEPGTEALLPVTPTESAPGESVGSTAETAPPLPVAPTDPAVPTEPIQPVPIPPTPVTEPPAPITDPGELVTQPPPPITEPSEPDTEPNEPFTESMPPDTEPSEPVTEPTPSDTEPSEPATEPTPPEETEETCADPAPEGPAEIPAEDLGWTWALLRTKEGDLLRITDAAGTVCTLDLTGRLESGTVIETCRIFGQERTLLLSAGGNGNWSLYVLEEP